MDRKTRKRLISRLEWCYSCAKLWNALYKFFKAIALDCMKKSDAWCDEFNELLELWKEDER